MSYQGWENYETWCVKLWIDNEESSYTYWQEAAEESWDNAPEDENTLDGTWSLSETARFRLADRLKEETEEGNPLADAGSMWSDLLGAALSEVNWAEIANALLEECEGYEYATFAHDES